jgi:hypothetical protein
VGLREIKMTSGWLYLNTLREPHDLQFSFRIFQIIPQMRYSSTHCLSQNHRKLWRTQDMTRQEKIGLSFELFAFGAWLVWFGATWNSDSHGTAQFFTILAIAGFSGVLMSVGWFPKGGLLGVFSHRSKQD